MSALAVFAPRRLWRLLISDAMNVTRDPMLMLASIFSVVPAIAFWRARDAMNEAARTAFGLERFSDYVAPVALLLPAFLIGWVTGFLLLEDRDEGPLLALDVTPVGKTAFLGYRVLVTAMLTGAVTLLATQLIVPERGWGVALLLTFLVALDAILAAAILPTIARNKVEGLALTKLTNLASVVPLLAALASPWRHLGAIVPTYRIGELLMLSPVRFLGTSTIAALAVVAHLAAVIGVFVALGRRAG